MEGLKDSLNSSLKTALQPVPFPREDDHSKFAEMYRKFTAAMEDSAKRTDFITAAPKLNPVSRFTDLTGPNNYNNVTNRNINENPVINQEFHITMPNVTNSTSAQALLADLQSIGHKKYQFFNTIKKV